MIRFIFNTLLTTLAAAAFLDWGRGQSEAQLDKMQQKVHFTPGAEAPVPPAVILAGAALLSGQLLLGGLLRLPGWQKLLSLLLGAIAGVAIFLARSEQKSK
jgi:hypothetical protein